MMKLEVFDPPMCCSIGVCGPNVDPALPRFAADLQWLKSRDHHPEFDIQETIDHCFCVLTVFVVAVVAGYLVDLLAVMSGVSGTLQAQ